MDASAAGSAVDLAVNRAALRVSRLSRNAIFTAYRPASLKTFKSPQVFPERFRQVRAFSLPLPISPVQSRVVLGTGAQSSRHPGAPYLLHASLRV